MRSHIIVGAWLVVGVFSVGGVASRNEAVGTRSEAVVNFAKPVRVLGQIVAGPVLVVHDDRKMERGEACTTFYRFDPARGPQEAIVSFHCTPVHRDVVATTRFVVSPQVEAGCQRLTEYQIAGESEAHKIPIN